MALLDMLRKEGKRIIVCHVNYGFRDSALRDENIVRKYCVKHNLILEVLNNVNYNKKSGNLENFARVVRYNFFKDMYSKYNCDFLYVGHNKDDLIETYYLQLDRDGKCDYYGLRESIVMYDMKVKRVLLSYSKEELKKYCDDNDIEYGVDETNFDNSYRRNNIRNNKVSIMGEEEKENVIKEINEKNVFKEKEYNRIHKLLEDCKNGNNSLVLDIFNKYGLNDKVSVLYYFVIEMVRVKVSISEKRLLDVVSKINSNKPNVFLGCFGGYCLYKEYSNLVIKQEEKKYCYIIEDLSSDLGKFEICDKGKKLEKVVVCKNQFPLKIMSYEGDNKEINRLFIDKKIPVSERKMWPIVKDNLDNVLLVLNIKKFYNIKDSNNEIIEFYVRFKEKERF